MYCNYCGKEITDGSAFCNHCGTRLPTATGNDSPEARDAKPEIQERKDKDTGCLTAIFITAIVIAAVIAVILLVTNTTKRDLRPSDYTYTYSQDLTSFTIMVTPKVKCSRVSVCASVLDSSGDTVYADTVTKTDLEAGLSYAFTFRMDTVSMLSGRKVEYEVTGKCVGK